MIHFVALYTTHGGMTAPEGDFEAVEGPAEREMPYLQGQLPSCSPIRAEDRQEMHGLSPRLGRGRAREMQDKE